MAPVLLHRNLLQEYIVKIHAPEKGPDSRPLILSVSPNIVALVLFAGHGVEEFFRESVKMNPHIIEDMHHIPESIAYLPTVMMVIGGLERPSAGRVRIDDHDLGALDEDTLARAGLPWTAWALAARLVWPPAGEGRGLAAAAGWVRPRPEMNL